MHIPSFIERKRDGHELSAAEIETFVSGYSRGEIPDYQASAWAMAVYFRGMTSSEISALTRSMMSSGRVFQHRPGSPPKVGKHSTGGIGDKVSLVLAPLLACDQLWVPKISGRGLGITGGTLDKLESIPGFSVARSEAQIAAQLEKIGVVIVGQTEDLCIADKKLYALRDVTATVPSLALIVSSIMCKKLAESLDRLVLDVKFGAGAFMKTRAEADLLAEALLAVGREMGVQTSCHLSPMDQPLGEAAGNALEVAEAVATLQGRGPADLVELTLDLCAQTSTVPREKLAGWLADGTAWNKFAALVEAQGGDSTALEKLLQIHQAPIVAEFPAPRSGMLSKMDAGAIGRACVALGAGRSRSSDPVDFAAGCSRIQKTGIRVERGQPLLRLHTSEPARLENALLCLQNAVEIL